MLRHKKYRFSIKKTIHKDVYKRQHVHRNAPGALGTLDNLMAQHGLNIVSQTLQTKGQIGYVITDVEGQVDDLVMTTLRDHPITVRCDRL